MQATLALLLTLLLRVTARRHQPYHRFQYDQRTLDCQCVPLEACPDNEVAVNGHGLLDPRIGNKICPNPEEICCDHPQDPPSREDRDPPPPEDRDLPDPPPKCGRNTLDPLASRITAPASTLTRFGELPWNLIVQEYVGDNLRHLYKCGAALIHPRAALTAAHCVAALADDPNRVRVRAGEWDTAGRAEPLPYQDAAAEEVLVHPAFNPLSLKNDVALIVLAAPFQLTDNVGLVCLGRRAAARGAGCVASGWGRDAYQGRYSPVLRKVALAVVEREECERRLRGTRLGSLYQLHKSFLCAGGEKGRDACKGDGGSPLICPVVGEEGRFMQVGIVSWGIGCGGEGIPGVYVNVEMYLEWIDSELGDRELDTSLYKI